MSGLGQKSAGVLSARGYVRIPSNANVFKYLLSYDILRVDCISIYSVQCIKCKCTICMQNI